MWHIVKCEFVPILDLLVRKLSCEITNICFRTFRVTVYHCCICMTVIHCHICGCKCAVSRYEQEKPRPGLSSKHVVIFFINVLTGSLDYNLLFVMDNIECKRFAEGEEQHVRQLKSTDLKSSRGDDHWTAMDFLCLLRSVRNGSRENRGGSTLLEPAMDTQNFQPRSLRRSKIMKIWHICTEREYSGDISKARISCLFISSPLVWPRPWG